MIKKVTDNLWDELEVEELEERISPFCFFLFGKQTLAPTAARIVPCVTCFAGASACR
ncbi:MAG: hypothetical protein ACFFBD_06300 [Candidatus Hodarchaeota archaeon]